MKIKIIDSIYIPSQGTSYVTIKTKYGVFTGKARLHPEDKANESSFVGCGYAEIRAVAQALKVELKEKRLILKEFENFEKELKCLKNYNFYSLEARKLRKRIYTLYAEIKELKTSIDGVEETIKKSDANRVKVLKKLDRAKKVKKSE